MINMENYEGYLYLYQEGELDSQTRAEVERFLLEHPDIREEMETYYDPSFVVTAEEPAKKSRRIVPLWRWAAAACAAVALGYGVWTMLPAPSSPEGQPLVAEQKPLHSILTSIPATAPQPAQELVGNRMHHAGHPSSLNHGDADTVSAPKTGQAEEATSYVPHMAEAAERNDYIEWQLAEETILVDCLAEEYTMVDNLATVETKESGRRANSLLATVIDRTASRQQAFVGILKEEVFPIFSTSDTLRTI